MIFLNLIYKISNKFWITNTLLHKFFQTDMIFFDQFKVPTIKIGKCFAELVADLLRICAFEFAYAKSRLTHDAARINNIQIQYKWFISIKHNTMFIAK